MRLITFFLFAYLFFSCSTIKHENLIIYGGTFDLILSQYKVKGTILIYDPQNKTYNSNSFHRANTGYLPAGTFLIPQTIIAIETRSINTAISTTSIDKNPKTNYLNMTIKEAYQRSFDPYYQDVIRKIGQEKTIQFLERLKYPKMMVNDYTYDNFWFYGPSKITPFEQIEFLENFFNNKMPIRKETYNKTLEIMLIKETNEYKLYGKESWTSYNNNGWFVGFIVKNDKKYYFATNTEPITPQASKDFSTTSKEATLEALRKMDIL